MRLYDVVKGKKKRGRCPHIHTLDAPVARTHTYLSCVLLSHLIPQECATRRDLLEPGHHSLFMISPCGSTETRRRTAARAVQRKACQIMIRLSLRHLAASTGGFSSAAFIGDDGGTYNRLKNEQERLMHDHQQERAEVQEQQYHHRRGGAQDAETSASASMSSSSSWEETCSPTGFHGTKGSSSSGTTSHGTAAEEPLERPTIDTYRAMTDSELIETLRTRDAQIHHLRAIYETFHYEADRHLRKMIFDYHDKTMQLSQVHGRMQQASLEINRAALSKMRDQQDMMTRDKRIIFTICTLWTLIFWVWVRRHYVKRRELEREPLEGREWAQMSPSITGAGSYNDNFFGSNKRNARFRETAWERELRERREAQDLREQQRTLLQNQTELQKAVAAQRAQQQEDRRSDS
ncbi:hypothetical protein LPMP_210950 [Leishmania panamensis]|uniref:Transmembrane protein n=1 Tax=Leishmania panamensis TaxID=5679 RepID=A0A088RQR3_LEIPA|nr:hypothetical protein LPMP_210950 [Leishmania panamensis]AIN98175.1 hypothetical protein LPMP_210950 [Leishmania panamensis]